MQRLYRALMLPGIGQQARLILFLKSMRFLENQTAHTEDRRSYRPIPLEAGLV